jgi:hypothetical protein
MKNKQLNSAQALLEHIGLKIEPLSLYGAEIHVKQWTASQRIKYLAIISDSKASEEDEIALVTPQGHIVAMSIFDDKGNPLFPHKWDKDKLVFEDAEGVNSLIQNRLEETANAFIEVAKFSGILFSKTVYDDGDETDPEEAAAKN